MMNDDMKMRMIDTLDYCPIYQAADAIGCSVGHIIQLGAQGLIKGAYLLPPTCVDVAYFEELPVYLRVQVTPPDPRHELAMKGDPSLSEMRQELLGLDAKVSHEVEWCGEDYGHQHVYTASGFWVFDGNVFGDILAAGSGLRAPVVGPLFPAGHNWPGAFVGVWATSYSGNQEDCFWINHERIYLSRQDRQELQKHLGISDTGQVETPPATVSVDSLDDLALAAMIRERDWAPDRVRDPNQESIIKELMQNYGCSNTRAKAIERVASPINRDRAKNKG
ncbi:hypothetical protein [Aeromonas caviae]|uniref:hypothetical protein n=1 Tax=Aeromonas caviae TaxID=648 RepID=UPI002B461457|nr:hypothetical protein [Aeromonas caviae]